MLLCANYFHYPLRMCFYNLYFRWVTYYNENFLKRFIPPFECDYLWIIFYHPLRRCFTIYVICLSNIFHQTTLLTYFILKKNCDLTCAPGKRNVFYFQHAILFIYFRGFWFPTFCINSYLIIQLTLEEKHVLGMVCVLFKFFSFQRRSNN